MLWAVAVVYWLRSWLFTESPGFDSSNLQTFIKRNCRSKIWSVACTLKKDGGESNLSTTDSVLALHPAAPVRFPGVPKNISDFFILPRLIDSAAA